MALESSPADRRPHIFLSGDVPTERTQSKVFQVSSEAEVVESGWLYAKCITSRIFILANRAAHLTFRANILCIRDFAAAFTSS